MIDQIAGAMESDRRLRVFLESPRVSAQRKNEILQKAFGAQLAAEFRALSPGAGQPPPSDADSGDRDANTTTWSIASKAGCTRR